MQNLAKDTVIVCSYVWLICNVYAEVPGLYLLTGTIEAGRTAPLGHGLTETGLPAQKEEKKVIVSNDMRHCGITIHTGKHLGQVIGKVTHSMC